MRATHPARAGRGRGNRALCAGAVVALALAAAPPAAALTLQAGLSLPTGDFGDRAGLGYNLGATVAYPLAPGLAWGVLGSYHRLPVDDDWSPAPGLTEPEGSWQVLEGLAIARAGLPMGGPFGLAGLGLARTWDDLEEGDAEDSTDLAYVVGGGFGLGPLEMRVLWHGRGGDGGSLLSLAAGLGF